ncbi:TPA: hypothetical protein QDC20_002622 [Burkholderia aenigmatica]|uniref:hypothetical protein n=1 Tax=Burkholderia sp. AU45251 TaxID=3059204 RepID=UPI002997C0B6|nr:hypothetical protein [Burkholderia aenigmatica]HDR9515796.1 hypothetical protein [Burkholderia aenigmatica]HDR9592605.1 hypothetical protein [Burkholderia aenigmatica]HDR9599585.1 hypothetical protein [Burkholderia aenigmatica]HDR9606505.1 hypothetical protein [Burkholderia aenigmatica]
MRIRCRRALGTPFLVCYLPSGWLADRLPPRWLIVFPSMSQIALLVGVVIVIGLLTCAVRGLYWSVLERCDVPARITGLAIGIVSRLGYSPDVFLPLLNG